MHRRIEYAQRLKHFNVETPLLGLDRTPEHYCRLMRNLECFIRTVGDIGCSTVEYIHPSRVDSLTSVLTVPQEFYGNR
jgi:hypothetical protein